MIKKFLSLALCFATVSALSLPAFAVTEKVDANAELSLKGFKQKSYTWEERAQYVQTSGNKTCGFIDGEWELKRSGNEIRIALHSELFNFSPKQKAGVHMRTDMLKHVGFKVVNSKNLEGTIKRIELDESKSAIRIQTVDYYTHLGMTDVELEIVVTLDGKTFGDALSFKFNQAYENHGRDLEAGMKEVEWAENMKNNALATIPNFKFWGDEKKTAYATKTVNVGAAYIFNIDERVSAADTALMAKFPEVAYVYTVHSAGMENSIINFSKLGRTYFVYNEKGILLGTTDDSLPHAGKYYLTTKEVTLTDDASAYVAPKFTIGTGGILEDGTRVD